MIEAENNQEREREREIVKRAVEQLGEHFDSVQVFCSGYKPGGEDGTFTTNLGAGNWLTRFGQVREWVIYEEEKIRQHARAQSRS